MIQSIMQELLQKIDPDYYRSVRLLIVHAELDKLREGRPASLQRPRYSALLKKRDQ